MGLRGSIWTLFYLLLRSINGLQATFFHEWHGLRRNQEGNDDVVIDVEVVAEILIYLFAFHFKDSLFSSGEIAHLILNNITENRWKEECNSRKEKMAVKLKKYEGKVAILAEAQKYEQENEREAFARREGGLVNVYNSLKAYIDEKFIPDLDTLPDDFFRFEVCEEYRKKSISYALRSGRKNYKYFAAIFLLFKTPYLSRDAAELLTAYERYIYATSQCGKLHWIFLQVKQAIIMKARRVISAKVTQKEENEQSKDKLDDDIEMIFMQFEEVDKEKVPATGKRKRAEQVPLIVKINKAVSLVVKKWKNFVILF